MDKTTLNFEGIQVLVIGDVMIDRYLRGSVLRISPEAPVPVLEKAKFENCLGGAANVALNIKHLGAVPHLFGLIGNNDDGEILKSSLEASQIDANYLIVDPSRVTTVKTRVIANKQHLLRVDKEDRHTMHEEIEKTTLSKLNALITETKIDIAIFQDYNKGFLSQSFIKKSTQLLQENDIPFIVDPKKDNFWQYKNATIFKPNLKEVKEALGVKGLEIDEYLRWASQEIKSKMKVAKVVITLASDGIYGDFPSENEVVPTREIKVRDVCGAGDAVISILALCEAKGLPSNQMLRLSNLAGGIVCEKNGVSTVTINELNKEISSLD